MLVVGFDFPLKRMDILLKNPFFFDSIVTAGNAISGDLRCLVADCSTWRLAAARIGETSVAYVLAFVMFPLLSCSMRRRKSRMG